MFYGFPNQALCEFKRIFGDGPLRTNINEQIDMRIRKERGNFGSFNSFNEILKYNNLHLRN